MAELVFHKIQLGAESVEGTAVPATVIFPCDPGAITELDRAPFDPVEDYGVITEQQPGRGTYGVRMSRLTLPAVTRYEDIMRLLEMSLTGGVTPSGGVWTYTADNATDALKTYTIEEGTTDGQAWQLNGCLVDQLVLEYGPINAPGAFPWKATATIMGWDRKAVNFTAGLSAPSNMESVQGHLTTLAEGSNSVAYNSLPALTSALVSYRLTVNNQIKLRVYGGAADTATAHGRMRRQVAVEAMIKIATTPTNDVWQIYNTAGAVATERRWQIKATGSGTKALTVNHLLRFKTVLLGDRDGEQTYRVTGTGVLDSGLGSGSPVQILVANSVGNLP